MESVKISEIKEFLKEKFVKKVPLTTDKLVFNVFCFKPRQFLPFHKHPATDELFYIVEGLGEFSIGNEQILVDGTVTVYGPADVLHGVVNSGEKDMVLLSVQGPKPVEMVYAENATLVCSVCKQEFIIKGDAKDGDKVVCPRCGAKFTISRGKDGKWSGKQV